MVQPSWGAIFSHQVPTAKIQLRGHFVVDRAGGEPLALQIARQLQEAIESGGINRGARLPSTRALARALGVSRNTVLTAYEELTARGVIRGRRGSGMYVSPGRGGFPVRRILRDAQYPARRVTLQDPDGNPLYLSY